MFFGFAVVVSRAATPFDVPWISGAVAMLVAIIVISSFASDAMPSRYIALCGLAVGVLVGVLSWLALALILSLPTR